MLSHVFSKCSKVISNRGEQREENFADDIQGGSGNELTAKSHRKTPLALNRRIIKSQVKSDVDKCKVMRMGKDNPSFTYKIMGSEVAISTWEWNFRVIIDSSMQMSAQCSAAIKKANRKLGIIRGREQNRGNHYAAV